MKSMNRRSSDDDWHLDKKFSIGIILAIILQCACFVWYGAKMDSDLQENKTNISELRLWREKQDDEKAKIESHLAVMDQKLTDQSEKLGDQSKILQRIDERLQSQTINRKN